MSNSDHGENIIEVSDISFSYGATQVLKDITLSIHRGDYLGIVGGNGAGKTSLLKIILGLLSPQKGKVLLFGQDIREFKDWSKIGYVPQKVTNFDPNFPATVREVVLMGRYGRRGLMHRVTEEDRTEARKALEQVEMWEYKDRQIGDLSGGQQQRVFIARALAGKPEVIFLDEPTVGVETHIKDEFYALLRKLNEDLHLTVVLITHDIESMAHEAMHIACIDHTIFFHDSIDAYFKDSHAVVHPHP
ncbi:MAG: abc transporter ATP-binding protein [Candidatus Kaiserbacteria bacterium]|nr:abc transporter ATP-binding protein [Candidatus Kaiserbacteria bacterium]